MPRELPKREEVASYVGYLLRRAHLAAGDCLAEHGDFQPKSAAILQVIREFGPVSQRWVAEYLDVNRSVMVKLIDDLESAGAVARHRNPADRRSYALAVTPAGERYMQTVEGMARSLTAEMTYRLSTGDRARLNGLLVELLRPYFDPPLPATLRQMTGFLVAQGHLRLSGMCDAALGPHGLSTRTFVALAVLETGTPWAQHELGAWLFIGPAATVELVDELESIGAVRRERSTTDRRSHTLVVTDEGARLLSTAVPLVSQAGEAFTASLGEGSREELVGLLGRMVGAGLESALPARRTAVTR